MTSQPEAFLEAELVQQLHGLGYERVRIEDEAGILSNLKRQLERFNKTTFSERDMTRILIHLGKGTIYDRAKTLRDRYALAKEDGTVFYVRFFDGHNPAANFWQVTNQVTMHGSYENRYDVTVLVNGLPLVQVELKRRGLELKEAFNQILRYKRHSFWANSTLFQYVQLFVISNGVNTKYYVNNPLTSLTFKQTYYWAGEDNGIITDLPSFTTAFLNTAHLGRMLGQYVVLTQAKLLMVLRPYQVYAVEAIVNKVQAASPSPEGYGGAQNGYIWHTTGSGKTLTSFKASQVITDMPEVAKVIFVVDRKDLDYQTMREFNGFKEGSVDSTENTKGLVQQLGDDTKLIVTTIQKLKIAISKVKHEQRVQHLKDQRLVFIFDECHRSQFGDTHKAITTYFTNTQLFGFTGTPIFAENAAKNEYGKRTTKDLFGDCLHKYVITDAIRDENVLRFSVDYVGKYTKKDGVALDIEVEDIDRSEVYKDPVRMERIADHIIATHDRKTHGRAYSALFATSGIEELVKYYDIFWKKKMAGKHDLRIAAIYTYGTNEDDAEAIGALPEEQLSMAAEPPGAPISSHSRDKLEQIISHYNAQYRTAYSTKDQGSLENYFKDISKKLKDREKVSDPPQDRIDLVLVVHMMLTGFDAKKVSTLYVDKNLRYHGLIQAYSRTNRILNEQKSQGNIVAYRNLKAATDEAIALFSNKDAKEVIFLPPYEAIVKKFMEAYKVLMGIAPEPQWVDALPDEEQELAFITAFRTLMRLVNVLKTFSEFTWDDLPMTEQEFADYTSKYLDLREKAKSHTAKQKASILEDIDFELELIHRDEINVAYILKLLARLKVSTQQDAAEQKKKILALLTGDVELRSKRELIEQFINDNLPHIADADNIPDDFDRYWQEQKVLALERLCQEEHLDKDQFNKLIDAYIFTGQEPLKEDVFRCLGDRPSVLRAREIGERIIDKMKGYVEVFLRGMVG